MSQNEMMKVRKEILTAVNKNKEREKKDAIYAEMLTNALTSAAALEHAKKTTDHMENILDIRYDNYFCVIKIKYIRAIKAKATWNATRISSAQKTHAHSK
jgi:hypothetical protein